MDMIRCSHIIDIVEEDSLMENAANMGDYWSRLMAQHTDDHNVNNIRNLGLIMAFDCLNTEKRNELLRIMRENHKLLALGCGSRTLRFRPALDVSKDDILECVNRTIRSIKDLN